MPAKYIIVFFTFLLGLSSCVDRFAGGYWQHTNKIISPTVANDTDLTGAGAGLVLDHDLLLLFLGHHSATDNDFSYTTLTLETTALMAFSGFFEFKLSKSQDILIDISPYPGIWYSEDLPGKLGLLIGLRLGIATSVTEEEAFRKYRSFRYELAYTVESLFADNFLEPTVTQGITLMVGWMN